MKKKSHPKNRRPLAASPSALALVRTGSAYAGVRSWLGIPFYIAGFLFLLSTLVSTAVLLNSLSAASVGLFAFSAVISLLAALFCFGIAALAAAVFDIADCAVLADHRARAAELRQAHAAHAASHSLDWPS